jgi:hypothetical protein
MHSIDIVYTKYRQGLKDIRDEHSRFFEDAAFTIFDCYTFQYTEGSPGVFAIPSYYHGRNYHKLLPEIKDKVKTFIEQLFEWVAEQKFED